MSQKKKYDKPHAIELSEFLYSLQSKEVTATKNTVNLFLKKHNMPLNINFRQTGFFFERRVVPLCKPERDFDCTQKRKEIIDRIKGVPKQFVFAIEEYGYQNFRDKKMFVISRGSILRYCEIFELGRESKLSNNVMIIGMDGQKFNNLIVDGEYYTFDEMKKWFLNEIIRVLNEKRNGYTGKIVILLDEFFEEVFIGMDEIRKYKIELVFMDHSESKKLNPLTLALNSYNVPYSLIDEELLEMIYTKCGFVESNFIRTLSQKSDINTTSKCDVNEEESDICSLSLKILEEDGLEKSGPAEDKMKIDLGEEQRSYDGECKKYSNVSDYSEGDSSVIEIPRLTVTPRRRRIEIMIDDSSKEVSDEEMEEEMASFSEEKETEIVGKEEILKMFYLQLSKEQKEIYHRHVKTFRMKESLTLKRLEKSFQKEIKKEMDGKSFQEIGNCFERFMYLYLRHPFNLDEINSVFSDKFIDIEKSLMFAPLDILARCIDDIKNKERVYGCVSLNQIINIAKSNGISVGKYLINEIEFFGWRKIKAPNFIFYEEIEGNKYDSLRMEFEELVRSKCKGVSKSFIFCIGNLGGKFNIFSPPTMYVNPSVNKPELNQELKHHYTNAEGDYPIIYNEGFLLNNMLCCLCSDGSCLKLLTNCDNDGQRKNLNDLGKERVFIGSDQIPFIDKNTFIIWFESVVLGSIEEKINLNGYKGKIVIIVNEYLKEYLEDRRCILLMENKYIDIVYIKQEIEYYCNPMEIVIEEFLSCEVEKKMKKGCLFRKDFYKEIKMYSIWKYLSDQKSILKGFQNIGIKMNLNKNVIEWMNEKEKDQFNGLRYNEIIQPLQIQLKKEIFSFETKYTKPLFRILLKTILKNIEWKMLESKYDLYDYLINNYTFLIGTNFDMFLDYQQPKQLSRTEIQQYLNLSQWDYIDGNDETVEILEPPKEDNSGDVPVLEIED